MQTEIIHPVPETAALTLAARDMPARDGDIIFHSTSAGPILIIKPDGSLVRGEGFRTDDEASVAFFECISAYIPGAIAGLRERAEKAEAELAARKADDADERPNHLENDD